MRVCGIVAEYDPFHLGHLYHLRQARQLSGADYVVCVISCAFSQRGAPALFSTHDRARMALQNGADLVLGMPARYGCAAADDFALGGIGILAALGVVTHLAFGTEVADLARLEEMAQVSQTDAAFRQEIGRALKSGHSYARAWGEAMEAHWPGSQSALATSPNMILAIAYLRVLQRLDSTIKPVAIPRRGSYKGNVRGAQDGFASASTLRNMLLRGDWQNASRSLPQESLAVIQDAMLAGHICPPDALDKAQLWRLATAPSVDLAVLQGMREGIQHRLQASARAACSIEEAVQSARTRRYVRAGIRRALSHVLLDMPAQKSELPSYARLLGLRQSAGPLLSAVKQSGFALIDRPARSRGTGIREDMRAEMLWHIGAGLPAGGAYRQQTVVVS